MLALYTLSFYVLLPFIVLRLLWRSRRAPLYRQRLGERFGFISTSTSEEASVIWVHAVSVGEVLAARPLIEQFLQSYPEKILWVTTTTPTGSEQVIRLFGSRVKHSYIPYDIPCAVERFLQRVQPSLFVIMETEIWPVIIDRCYRRDIPVLLVNGRLSERSFKKYQRVTRLSHQTFSKLCQIAAQSDDDATRFQLLGARSVSVTGSIKADVDITDTLRAQAQQLNRQWFQEHNKKAILAASTHSGEDEILLEAFSVLQKRFPELLLMIAPRHPERFDSVYKLCQQYGCQVQRRSQIDKVEDNTDIVLIDTVGELLMFCGIADVVVMGGTFIDHGGHNFLEPAAWGVPVVSGRSDFNFSSIAAGLRQNDFLVQVDNSSELAIEVEKLLNNKILCQKRGEYGREFMEQSRGALLKTLAVIKQYLS